MVIIFFIITFYSEKNLSLNKSGNYRIYQAGAGIINGGYGGLIYNDYELKNNDLLSIIVGTSGERIPVKGKESINKLNNI